MTFKARSSRTPAAGSLSMKTPGSARYLAARFSAMHVALARLGVVIGLAACVSHAHAVTPSSEDGFAPRANAQVVASAIDSAGRIIVGGYFTELQTSGVNNPISVGRLARINGDGSIDATFLPGADGPVTAILLEPDGKIVIGGYFTNVNSGSTTVARNRVARFNADGTVDTSFNPNVSGNAPALVHVAALARDSSGRILIGGEFTTIAPNDGPSQARQRIARFNSNGTFDTTFTPGFNNVVKAIAVHPSGEIIVAGGFTSATSAGDPAVVTRGRIARLTSAGALTPYNPNANNLVTALAFQLDGKMIAVGNFTSLQPTGATAALLHSRIVRINNNGTTDEAFRAGLNSDGLAVAVTPDGMIVVSGVFRGAFSTGQTAASRADFIARFAADGTLDTSFFPGPSYTVSTFALQADGKIFVGGSFTDFFPAGNVRGIGRRYMARLNEDGSLDTSLDPSVSGGVNVVVAQADGRILLGGSFSSIAGITRRSVARISANGAVDPVFNPSTNGTVSALAEQANKMVLIGGSFSQLTPNDSVTPVTRNSIARVTETGEIDADFDPNPNGAVSAIAVQSDNKILIGGSFTSLTPKGTTTAVTRTVLARLESSGAVDTGFTTSANGAVSSIVVEPDGRILIAGNFSTVIVGETSHTAAGVARLNADGTFVSGFAPNTNNPVSTVRLYGDGKILIGGSFTTVTPSTGPGSPLTTHTRNGIAMLNSDGSLVESFDPNPNDVVNTIVPLEGGDILVGGRFSAFTPNGATEAITRRGLARIKSDGTLVTTYDPNPSSQIVAMIVQSTGDAIVAGPFTGFRPAGSVAVQLTGGLARIKPDGSVDAGFKTSVGGATGDVRTLAYRADGTMFIGGAFSSIAGSTSRNLIRLRSEGLPDIQFHPDADGPVEAIVPRTLIDDDTVLNHRIGWLTKDGNLRSGLNIDPDLQIDGNFEAVAIQGDGGILVGGSFTATVGDHIIMNLARFNPDGSLDTTFNPGPDSIVYDVKVKGNHILVVGAFTKIGSVTRNRIAMLTSTGALVTAFDPNANGVILAAAFQPDDKILIGGQFTTLAPGTTTAVTLNRIARLNADGTVDTAFNPNTNADVTTIVIQPGSTATDFKIVIGGSFTTLQPNGAATATTRNAMARLNADGTLDTEFDPKPNGAVVVIKRDSNGLFLVGGQFTSFQPNGATETTTRNNIARVNTNGTLDTGFNPNANGPVLDIDFQSDNKLIVGGVFSSMGDVVRSRIARLNTDGTLDTSFNPNAGGAVGSVVVLTRAGFVDDIIAAGGFSSFRIGGVVLAGGAFQKIGNATIPYLALLSTDGTPISGAAPLVNNTVRALALDESGRVVVGGDFTTVGGAPHAHLARLNADDTLDTSFNASADGSVHALALQADDKILIGGLFTTVGAGSRVNLARLNSDGTLDAAFTANTNANGLVTAITVQGDGQILVGGNFTTLAGSNVANIGRLNTNGAIDGSFAPVVNGTVNSIAVQTDGSILIGGAFSQVNGTARNGIAKLSPTGVLDMGYDPQANASASVSALVLAPDGKLIVGGTFSEIGGQSRYLIARLKPSVQAKITLTVGSDNQSIEWLRSDSSPEILAATFEVQEDGIWGSPIEATRFTSGGVPGWRAPVAEPFSTDKLLYIRARGVVVSNRGSSISFIETVRAVYIPTSGGGSEEPTEIPARPANFLVETYLSAHPELANTLYQQPDRLDLAWVHYWTYSRASDVEQNYLPPAGQASVDPKLNNLSARAWVGPGEDSLVIGVYVSDAPARLLVRARGPSLAPFNIPNPLADPTITVYSEQTPIASNDDWESEASVTPQALTEAGIAMTDSRDAAIVITLEPGLYTFIISGKNGSGVGLGELFLLSGPAGRLTNLSARARVGEGGDILIAGFNRVGVGEILARSLGPELAKHDIVNFLSDPYITLHRQSTGTLILANNDWGQVLGAISDKNARAGALPLPEGSKDAAAYMVLGSGGYTIHVSGAAAGQTGVAIIELFELQ
jgi:uncharacterized delta-60 repeat protein